MILIVGYGNPTRSDDGIGIEVANRIARENFSDVTVIITQQLHLDVLEEISECKTIILVDASQETKGVSLKKVDSGDDALFNSSHHLRPELLLALAKRLYGLEPELYVCSIQGENFDFGDTLSPKVKKRAQKAFHLICGLLPQPLTQGAFGA